MTELSEADDSEYEDDIEPVAVELKVIKSKQGAKVVPLASPESRNFALMETETITPIEDDELRTR
jgi:hypothetical protein